MRIGRVLYPISALGPGPRFGLWVQGCTRNCEGCANPELQNITQADVPIDILIGMARAAIKSYNLQGVTISGGEPVLQAEELVHFLDAISDLCNDILLFTGFSLEELQALNDSNINTLLKSVSVLIDGPYIESLNRGELLRGSENQRIYCFNPSLKAKYESYLLQDRRVIDNFIVRDGVVAVGIHPNGCLR